MFDHINKILVDFRGCFSRAASFDWFVIIVIGLMLRGDTLGVTSIIRDLALKPSQYESMLHFFRSTSWSLARIFECWTRVALRYAPVYRDNNRLILIGDGVKQSKEGRYMPGVKKLHQESENSGKPEYIFGHMFGSIGILIGSCKKLFCLPLLTTLQDGISSIRKWGDDGSANLSHVVQTIDNAFSATQIIGNTILLLDRYFLTVPALNRLNQLNATNNNDMQVVTKAKRSIVAYEEFVGEYSGRGRPKKRGSAVRLNTWFDEKRDHFRDATINLYGHETKVAYLCVDLLWGMKLYQKLRFVLTIMDGKRSILVSTDLQVSPEDIIRLYGYRFKIECTFREFKQVLGGFCYRFWSSAVPKLTRYNKKSIEALESIGDTRKRELITDAVKAVEGYVMLSSIAMGILQILSLTFERGVDYSQIRYLRTWSKINPSEATVSRYIKQYLFYFMAKRPDNTITKIIIRKQLSLDNSDFTRIG